MTMHELEQLLQQHYPSAPPQFAKQGRAGVTSHLARSNTLLLSGDTRMVINRDMNYDPDRAYDPRMKWDNRVGYYKPGICIICGGTFDVPYGTHRFYDTKACKQKAYRQRKKGTAA